LAVDTGLHLSFTGIGLGLAVMWGLHKALVMSHATARVHQLLGGAAATSTLPLAAHAWKRQKSSAAIAILRCV
jgi:hypothetical protein